MTETSQDDQGSQPRGADGVLRWIGDLDHPFYSDERNRYVWYEASAIAFQLLFMGNYFLSGLVLWVAGADALPYVLVLFAPTMIAAVIFQGYLKHHSAEYWPTKNDLGRRRGQLAVLGGVVLLSGLVRATLDLQSFTGGSSRGAAVGVLACGLSGFALAFFMSRRQEKQGAAVYDEE